MSVKTKKQILKQLKIHTDNIGRERDALRNLFNEVEDIINCADDGLEQLEQAISTISERM